MPLASRAFGAGARSALASVCQPWVPMKTSNAPLTVLAPCVIPAAQASACVGIAFICTPIADTRPAVGEAPLATLTVVTAEAKGAGPAGTLPASPFAQGAEGPIRATLAGLTPCRAKAVIASGTGITAASNHPRFAPALAPVRAALGAQRALRVTLAWQGTIVDQGGQADEEGGAGLRERHLAGHQAFLVATVALKGGTALQGGSVTSTKHL